MILIGGLVLRDGVLKACDVRVEDTHIVEVGKHLKTNDGERTIDVNGGWIIPGGVDVHVHLREPGFEHKETAETGTRAACKGGYTTIMSMPNLNPVSDSVAHVEFMRNRVMPYSYVRVCPYASVTVGEEGKKLVDFDALNDWVYAFSDDGKGIEDVALFKQALLAAKRLGALIASHAEAKGYGFLPEAEYIAVEREINAVRETGGRLHFCHMSTRKSFELIAAAKQEGLDITCEVTPHHLFLNENEINGNTNFKMNPPLRSEDDRQAALEALCSGVADFVATDHAPHSEAEKAVDYSKAPSGIIGLETALPLLYTNLVMGGKISLERFVDITSKNAGTRFDVPYSTLSSGDCADLTVLDIDGLHTYVRDEICSKGKNSPFIGQALYGFPSLTMVAGKIVWQR